MDNQHNDEARGSPFIEEEIISTASNTLILRTRLDHLKASSADGDSLEFKASVHSYNAVIVDLAAVECPFCGAPGHSMAICPLKWELRDRWRYDPVRLHVLEGLIDELRKPLSK